MLREGTGDDDRRSAGRSVRGSRQLREPDGIHDDHAESRSVARAHGRHDHAPVVSASRRSIGRKRTRSRTCSAPRSNRGFVAQRLFNAIRVRRRPSVSSARRRSRVSEASRATISCSSTASSCVRRTCGSSSSVTSRRRTSCRGSSGRSGNGRRAERRSPTRFRPRSPAARRRSISSTARTRRRAS